MREKQKERKPCQNMLKYNQLYSRQISTSVKIKCENTHTHTTYVCRINTARVHYSYKLDRR